MYNPNDIAIPNGNFFGFPDAAENAEIVFLPVEWDATTSYRKGAAQGAEAILEASLQLDFFDLDVENAWKTKITTAETIHNNNQKIGKIADEIIVDLEKGRKIDTVKLNEVNAACSELNEKVYERSRAVLMGNEGTKWSKKIALIGGDHSCPLGLIRFLAEKNSNFGILHIDAHADLRHAYEGFIYSHASIMYNVLNEVKAVSQIVQVGLRDFSPDEYEFGQNSPRVKQFFDRKMREELFNGGNWHSICEKIVKSLPDKVYVSFDIDGLSPDNCPNTGTPVPGGMSYNEAVYLLKVLKQSGREVIGFDLCEVAPSRDGDEWDANVGARILYQLCLLCRKNLKCGGIV
ncbi:agmatinase [Bacteroidia bacterium]|nr:agmatinase [Bacteroidia bacterium]